MSGQKQPAESAERAGGGPSHDTPDAGTVAVVPAVPGRRARVVALAQKVVILAGAAAALWLVWKALGPQECSVCGRDRPAETGVVARQMKLKTGGRQNP